jgi:hypothetical protein
MATPNKPDQSTKSQNRYGKTVIRKSVIRGADWSTGCHKNIKTEDSGRKLHPTTHVTGIGVIPKTSPEMGLPGHSVGRGICHAYSKGRGLPYKTVYSTPNKASNNLPPVGAERRTSLRQPDFDAVDEQPRYFMSIPIYHLFQVIKRAR